MAAVTPEEAGLVRTRYVRAYPDGNFADQAAACESLEALKELVDGIRALAARGRVSRRSLRRAKAAVDTRRRELETRVVQSEPLPLGTRRTPAGLVVPR